ncbi:hypothetical protein [Vibrio hyugaensis]|uniref:hypothetical protein n=1 Tax=Vibrio hyugaensis TaxID=1534743 RepID=UPI0005F02AFD|nr:hypothetical protein [Vibrio hyugaensis]
MSIAKFIKGKVEQGKKAAIKSQVKGAVKKKVDLDENWDDVLDTTVDKAIDKLGVDNIIKASKVYKELKK